MRNALRIIGILFGLLLLLVLVRRFDRGRAADVPAPQTVTIVAHRGAHTNWRDEEYDLITGCEAIRILPPAPEFVERGLIENTIESIGAAFDYGATVVEIDIRRTADNELVIYHDSLLACRTDGEGTVEEQPLSYLKTLDIGYGYTADDGQSYPFRGKGVGRMPTLREVLAAYPERSFMIDHKDASLPTAQLLAEILATLPAEQRAQITYWGPPEALEVVQSQAPEVQRLIASRRQMKDWVIPHLATLGFAPIPVPEGSQGVALGLPAAYARWVWGWPYRFLERVHAAGARFFLMVDSAEDAARYADLPVDGVITDYIEVIGSYFD